MQEFSKALEDADEKVQLANQIYELVPLLFDCVYLHFKLLFFFNINISTPLLLLPTNFVSASSILSYKVERHLRKLDQEVLKFKMELEADNAGITEVLEKSEKFILLVCSFIFKVFQ